MGDIFVAPSHRSALARRQCDATNACDANERCGSPRGIHFLVVSRYISREKRIDISIQAAFDDDDASQRGRR